MLRCYFNLGLILDQRKASGVKGRESSRICGETTPRGFIFVAMCWTLPTTPRSQVVHPRETFSARVAHEIEGHHVKVLPAYSTQECCICGALNPVPLSVLSFICRGCGRTVDRDFNAAWIVLKRGLAQVGQDMPELKPVEIRPLPTPMTECVRQVDEAGTTRHEIGAESPRCSVAGGCHFTTKPEEVRQMSVPVAR